MAVLKNISIKKRNKRVTKPLMPLSTLLFNSIEHKLPLRGNSFKWIVIIDTQREKSRTDIKSSVGLIIKGGTGGIYFNDL